MKGYSYDGLGPRIAKPMTTYSVSCVGTILRDIIIVSFVYLSNSYGTDSMTISGFTQCYSAT